MKKYHQTEKDRKDESHAMKGKKVAHHLKKAAVSAKKASAAHKRTEKELAKAHEAAAGRKYNKSEKHRKRESEGMKRSGY